MGLGIVTRKFRGKNIARLNNQRFIDIIDEEAVSHALTAKELLDKPTETWFMRPEINVEIRHDIDGINLKVVTDDNVYRFLNDGTSIRWAVMSDDFIPKTEVDSLESGPGAGHVFARGNEVDEPRPGIDARNWTHVAKQIVNKAFRSGIRNAIKRGVTAMEEFGG